MQTSARYNLYLRQLAAAERLGNADSILKLRRTIRILDAHIEAVFATIPRVEIAA
jgi:hypothetical protein